MTFTKAAFGNALKAQVKDGYEPQRLARWAFVTYLDHANEMESGLYDEVMKVAMMEVGPQFEMTKDEIEHLADELSRN